jgi:predicted porin
VQPTFELRAIYDLQRDANGKYGSVVNPTGPGALYDTSKELILGGTVTITSLKLFAGYENLRAPDVAPGTGPDRANLYWLGANYQLDPALMLIAAAYHTNVNQGVGSANLFMVGANYNLSKRTLLYASVGTVRNSAHSDFSVEYGDSGGGIAGQNQNAFYTGISHSF